jgi:hypothetical protein
VRLPVRSGLARLPALRAYRRSRASVERTSLTMQADKSKTWVHTTPQFMCLS